MPRKILARVEQVHDCPIFKARDQMVFGLPELLAAESDAVCAIAVSDLLPWAIKLTAGGRDAPERLLCRGCRGGRAQAGFSLEAHGETISRDPHQTQRLVSLRSIPLFAQLPERQLEKIQAMIQETTFQPGEEIISFGQPGKALGILIKGQVEVIKPDEAGEKLLGILSPGECFGEMSLLTGDPCSATIRARRDAPPIKVYTISKDDFDGLLGRNPVLNRYFSKLLALRLNKMSKQFTEQSTGAVVGELHMIGPTELIQAITVTDRTGVLKVQQGRDAIELLFHNGQIWRITVPGGGDPEETFYAFLMWSRGRFSFEPMETPPRPEERTVHKDTTSLLLEGMRRLDESDVGVIPPSDVGALS